MDELMGNAGNRPCEVVLVDTLSVVLRGVHSYLANAPDVRVVGSAQTYTDALRTMAATRPDVLILDPLLSEAPNDSQATEEAGVRLIEAVRAECEPVRILALTLNRQPRIMRRVLVAGAAGYILKSDDLEALPVIVGDVWRGKTVPYFSAEAMSLFAASVLHPQGARIDPDRFTRRERQILKLVVSGKDSKQIAVQLGISIKTVATHRSRILRKAKVRSFFELVEPAAELD